MIDAAWMHGWSGVVAAYTAVQAPMIAGLLRVRAQFHHYLLSPLVAAPLTAVAAAGAAVSGSLLGQHGLLQFAIGAGLGALLGYEGGKARGDGLTEYKSHQRGTYVAERGPSVPPRSRQLAREAGITLAGTVVPSQDETKHFKLIGTTGTGKSTAIQEILSSALARRRPSGCPTRNRL